MMPISRGFEGKPILGAGGVIYERSHAMRPSDGSGLVALRSTLTLNADGHTVLHLALLMFATLVRFAGRRFCNTERV